MELTYYILAIIFLGIGMYFAIAAFCIRKAVITERKDETLWVQKELERALRLVKSSNVEEIITGCQTLHALTEFTPSDISLYLEMLEIVEKLRYSSNPRVAIQATITHTALVQWKQAKAETRAVLS